jgi:hypothetical protein
MSDCFCPTCRLVVAPFAPDRRVYQGKTFHRLCLAKHLVRQDLQNRTGRLVRMRGEGRHVHP